MTREMAPCRHTLAWLASKATGSRVEFVPCACGQVLSSSPMLAVDDVEESTKKEQDLGRRESSARDRYDTSPV